jgi:hypothetical protein
LFRLKSKTGNLYIHIVITKKNTTGTASSVGMIPVIIWMAPAKKDFPNESLFLSG